MHPCKTIIYYNIHKAQVHGAATTRLEPSSRPKQGNSLHQGMGEWRGWEITQTDGVVNVGLEPPPISIHINQWKSCKQQLAVINDQNDPPPIPVLWGRQYN